MTEQKSLSDLMAPPAVSGALPAPPTRIFESIVLRFLARVIHADGHIDPKESAMLTDIAVQLGMGADEAKRILDDELTRKSDCAVLAAQISDRIRQREVYAMGCLVGASDGHVGSIEQTVLAEFARGASISDADATEILEAVVVATKGTKA
jgi:uncharacterized membrane protein YebE (DUF533 family)